MRIAYPYKTSHAENSLGQSNQFGVYPINRYNTWHGGLHIEGTNEICAIADGRIIAYRIPETYIEETLEDKKSLYSNGFMLIQHDYESKNKLQYRFYSLYHHIMSKEEMIANNKVPDFYGKPIYTIKAKQHIKGLNARASDDYSDVVTVIPKGHTVTIDTHYNKAENDKSHWRHKPKYKEYVKVSYHDEIACKTVKDIYIHKGYATLKDSTYTIKVEDDTNTKSESGASIYDGVSAKRVFQRIIKTGEQIEVEKTEGSWYKLKGKQEYVHKRDISFTNEIKDDVEFDKIINCDVPVTAGTIIAHTGKYGVEKQPNYRASHIEIFSHQNPNDLLTDAKNDGEKQKHYFKVKQGARLKKNLKFSTSLKKKTPVKVLEVKGEYSQIEVQDVVRTSKRSYLTNYKEEDHKSYEILDTHFDTVNDSFDGFINKGDKLYFVKQLDGDNRKLRYEFPDSGETFWIKTDAIKQPQAVTQGISSLTPRSFLIDGIDLDTGNTTTAPAPVLVVPAIDTIVPLHQDVSEYYLEQPIEDTEEDTVKKEQIIAIRKAKNITDPDKKKWHHILCTDAEGEKSGWIEETNSKLEKISAFDWTIFGFEALEAGNEFVYSVKDIMEAKETAPFIDTVWSKVDENQDKILDHNEWRNAYKRMEVVSKFSKLVCKHKNEWAYTADEIKSEIEQFFDMGIKLEEDDEKKQILEDKKQARLNAVEQRLKNLCFWKDIKDGEIAKPKEVKPKKKRWSLLPDDFLAPEPEKETHSKPRKFSSNPNVWHFHPIAFVEHMKLLVTKEDIDLRPLMTFIPQSKGPSCNATCRKILKQMDLTPYGSDNTMQLGYEKKDGIEMILGATEKAVNYIDKVLEYGHPVMVGVDHTFEYRKFGVINEGTTDHYVLIVGRKYESGKQFYIYWDVGTKRGASTEWKFEHRGDRLIADKTYKNPPKSFTVTQVRKNIGHDYK
ncbi:hypothetical protein ACSTS3_15060 [Aquimarina muelleri]|uniref:hypothetical protein n=1 Tax=Aquimarina muelleri TaxID=279356 RepID=UPI003F684A36